MLGLFAAHVLDTVIQIVPGKSCDEYLGVGQIELFQDVVTYVCRRRCGQRDGLRIANLVAELSQSSVVVAKVVTPFADAMGFVDRQQLNLCLAQRLAETGAAKSFGSDIQHFVFTRREPQQTLVLLAAGKGAVDERRSNAQLAQRVDLILHQCNQWRDHQGRAGPGDRWQLIAE